MLKFSLYNVSNGTEKARISYHLDNRTDGRACVTLYAKDFGHALGAIFADSAEYVNETDSQTDYFDKGRVVVFADSPIYATLRPLAEKFVARMALKYA